MAASKAGALKANALRAGDCVRVPDGRPGRVRECSSGRYRVRVRRSGSEKDEVLDLSRRDLTAIDPPAGWMSPLGWTRRRAAARRNAQARKASSAKPAAKR